MYINIVAIQTDEKSANEKYSIRYMIYTIRAVQHNNISEGTTK
jgi:hypothetical protein